MRPRTQMWRVLGESLLEGVQVADAAGERSVLECSGVFCFIGAQAATEWLPEQVRRDEVGFVLTGRDLQEQGGKDAGSTLPFESSLPGVFAVGDVRHDSTKRVATAVGEGAEAISSAHAFPAGVAGR